MQNFINRAPIRNVAHHKSSMIKAFFRLLDSSKHSDLVSSNPMMFKYFLRSFNRAFFIELNNSVRSPAKEILLDVNMLNVSILLKKILNILF